MLGVFDYQESLPPPPPPPTNNEWAPKMVFCLFPCETTPLAYRSRWRHKAGRSRGLGTPFFSPPPPGERRENFRACPPFRCRSFAWKSSFPPLGDSVFPRSDNCGRPSSFGEESPASQSSCLSAPILLSLGFTRRELSWTPPNGTTSFSRSC